MVKFKRLTPDAYHKLYFCATGISAFIGYECLVSTVNYWETTLDDKNIKF